MSYETPRDEVLSVLNTAGAELLTPSALYERCTLSDDRAQFSQLIFGLAKAGEISKHPAPQGSGAGVRFVYGPAGASAVAQDTAPAAPTSAPAAIQPSAPRGDGGAAAPRPGARAPKVHRTDAKRAAKARKTRRQARKGTLPAKVARPPHAVPPALTPPTRWALTSDGAFVLLGSDIEIPKLAARALAQFVDVLKRGEA